MKLRVLNLALSASALVMCACASNPFKTFYTDLGSADLIQHSIISTEPPRLISGTDPDKDAEEMWENNFYLIGYSSFNAGNINFEDALPQGVEAKAEIIIGYRPKYSHTNSGSIPLVVPNTQTATTTFHSSNGYSGTAETTLYGSQTTYIPYSQERYNYFASYWIRAKPLVLGIRSRDLTADQHREIASNKGIEITGVRKNSPAYKADLFKGDILLKIAGKEILNSEQFGTLLEELQGKEVELKVMRDKKAFKKTLTLGFSSP